MELSDKIIMHLLHNMRIRSWIHQMRDVDEHVKFLAIIVGLFTFSESIASPFIAVFLKDSLTSYSSVGFLFSLMMLIATLLDIPLGSLGDKIGSTNIIKIGILASVITSLIFAISGSYLYFALSLMVWGLSFAFWDGTMSFTRYHSPKGKHAQYIAYITVYSALGVIFGALIGGVIATTYGLTVTFYVWAALQLMTLLLAHMKLHMKRPSIIESVKKTIFGDHVYMKGIRDFEKLGLAGIASGVVIFLYGFIVMVQALAIPLLARSLDASYLTIALLSVVFVIPALFEPFFAKMGDKYGNGKVISIMWIPLAIVSFALGLDYSINTLFLLTFLFSIFMYGADSSIFALFTDITPKSEEGELTGVSQMLLHAGKLFGPLAAGIMADMFSINAPFILCSVLILFGSAIAGLINKK
jgi:DHA1 family multidrug resistance protein-like MFS transporter